MGPGKEHTSTWAVKVWFVSMWRLKLYCSCIKGFFFFLGLANEQWLMWFLQSLALTQIGGCGTSSDRDLRLTTLICGYDWSNASSIRVPRGRDKLCVPGWSASLVNSPPDTNWHTATLWQWELYQKHRGVCAWDLPCVPLGDKMSQWGLPRCSIPTAAMP